MDRRPRGEGSIYQRADGRWVGMLDITRPGENRRRKAIYGRTRREVQREMGRLQRELAAHGDLPTAHLTVEAWLRTWVTDIAPQRVRPTTLPSYRSKIEQYLIPAIGRHRLDKLKPEHVRAVYQGMESRGLAMATRRQTHAILKRALTVAVREGKVLRNVADLVDPPGTATAETEPFNATELVAVLEQVAGDRMESRWLAALVMGMRQGEVLGLGWQHINFDERTVTVDRALARVDGQLQMVPPKSKKSRRTVPLPRHVHDSLVARGAAYELERQADGYQDHQLVWAQLSGRPQDSRADWQAWVDLLDRAEVRRVRLHDARHCAATAMELLGVPLVVRMAILGHSQAPVAMKYSHADLAAMRAAVALIDQAHLKALED